MSKVRVQAKRFRRQSTSVICIQVVMWSGVCADVHRTQGVRVARTGWRPIYHYYPQMNETQSVLYASIDDDD